MHGVPLAADKVVLLLTEERLLLHQGELLVVMAGLLHKGFCPLGRDLLQFRLLFIGVD